MEKKKLVAIIALGVVIASSISGFCIYNALSKTDKAYSQAVSDLDYGNYSNAYYLFSKVSFLSQLKPLALYHQADCAERLDDKKSAIKKYKLILRFYPKNIMAQRAKYQLAQDLIETNPNRANKYFKQIIKSNPNSDYATASEYFTGLLIIKKYTKDKNSIFPNSEKENAEDCFRHYLKKAPSGKHALNVVTNWLSLDKNISKDDYLLMAKTYYLFNDYEKAGEMLRKVEFSDSWPLEVLNADGMGNSARVKYLTEWGLKNHADYVDREDIYSTVDTYIKNSDKKYQAIQDLFNISKGKGKDYIWDLLCTYAPQDSKFNCYNNLYLTYPNSEFADDALSQIFLFKSRTGDIASAKKIGYDFLNKYKNSKYTPMVMYGIGKIAEKQHRYQEYMNIYKKIVATYPDNYYAYRAYLRINHLQNPLISGYIEPSEISYPYKNKPSAIKKLIEFKDYDILEEYFRGDEFLQSWLLYRKNEIPSAMVKARDAMDKLETKPNVMDKRWQLVYPVYYYEDIKKYSSKAGNNSVLMLAIAREESYFNEKARSNVGALGLMQLMPQTAFDIASRYGISGYSLNNPKHNILLGNYYFKYLRNSLGGYDISAVAAYNGGIGSVNNWKQSINFNDTDEFIEQIPYPETRNYVKKVLRTYWNYLRIYR